MIALREASTTATLQAGVFASGTIATTASMKSGWLTPHCSACMPPIDGPTTATTWSMPNFSFNRRYCDSTMSRMANFGKLMRGCDFELLGEVVSPLPIASVQMIKYLSGRGALPGPIRKRRRGGCARVARTTTRQRFQKGFQQGLRQERCVSRVFPPKHDYSSEPSIG